MDRAPVVDGPLGEAEEVGLARYPNYNVRQVTRIDDCLPKVELIIHDDEKTWIKTSGENYARSTWIFSNNQRIVALAKYCYTKILKDSEPVILQSE